MEPATLLSGAAIIVAALFGTLSIIIGWVGSRVIIKQDAIMEKLDDVKDELHIRINSIDIRLTRVEMKAEDKCK